jgi:transcriptional regulator with XRE-family HTH domain
MQSVQKNAGCPKANIQSHKMEAVSMDIIKQLELYRLENRVTQVDLARDLKVAFSTVSRWLNGKNTPNKIQQYHIEKFLVERLGSLTPTMGRSESNLKKARRKKAGV